MKSFLIRLDMKINGLTGGSPKETLSSRWGRGARRDCLVCSFLCSILNMFDENHCEKNIKEVPTNGSQDR